MKVGAKSGYDLYFVLGGKAVQRESAIVWCLGGFSGQVHIFSRDLALGLTFGKPMFHLNITLYLKNLLRNPQVLPLSALPGAGLGAGSTGPLKNIENDTDAVKLLQVDYREDTPVLCPTKEHPFLSTQINS